MPNRIFELAHPLALRAAQVLARAAVARGAIQPADQEDVEQEGVVACWRAVANFDPNRASLRTYIEWVVTTRTASAVRATHRWCALCTLDFAADRCAGAAITHHELRIDVERLLGACSDGERRLARLLMEYTPSEASRILAVARSTVHDRIRRLRPRFIAAGLGPGTRQDASGSSRGCLAAG
jgi:RNA polymerase sigma factor (sigma-70 family)